MTLPIFNFEVSFFIFIDFALTTNTVYFLNYDIIRMEVFFSLYFPSGSKIGL